MISWAESVNGKLSEAETENFITITNNGRLLKLEIFFSENITAVQK